MPPTRRASVYVHFPWCLRKCPYCDFVSYATRRDDLDHEAYADAVLRELAARAEPLLAQAGPRRRFASVFFGGGTPSLWRPREIGRVIAGIRSAFECDPDLEVTVECNPTSLDEDAARALHEQGVNRLSIGTQSVRPEQLGFLGRLHDAEGAWAALRGALASGVARVSTDLIYGLPGQAPEDACAQAEALVGLGLAHLSCYQLTLEPGTQLFELTRQRKVPPTDDEAVAETFLALDRTLHAHGLAHYEISNYARPGEEARHNLGYWRGEEYLGLGCAAFGFLRCDTGGPAAGVRYRNELDPSRYVDSTRSPGCVRDAGTREPLDGETLLRERIMLGLRLAAGVDLTEAAADLGVAGWTAQREQEAERLVERGRLTRDGARLRIPAPAWLWADDTAARLM
jgi:oxygen-independent coproporphyrinogen-3 oxidase